MNRLLLSTLLGACLVPMSARAVDPVWINNGIIDRTQLPPQIDATTVINNGSFTTYTPLPFETSDTLNFTNTGTMNDSLGAPWYSITNTGILIGSSGWLFDFSPSTFSPSTSGSRSMAGNFFNANSGSVYGENYLLVHSTNIISPGQLSVSVAGVLELLGHEVNLRNGGLAATPVGAVGSVYPYLTNFFIPATGLHDLYWAETNFSTTISLDSSNVWNGSNITTVAIPSPPAGPGAIPSFSIGLADGMVVDSFIANSGDNTLGFTNYTIGSDAVITQAFNVTYPTNTLKQALFVVCPPQFALKEGFTPAGSASNFLNLAAFPTNSSADVLISLPFVNVATGVRSTNSIRFQDTLASVLGRSLMINALDGTFRPTNYNVDRLQVDPATNGNNGIPNSRFFFTTGDLQFFDIASGSPVFLSAVPATWTNWIETAGDVSAYSVSVDNVAIRPPRVLGGAISNVPGSIRIFADNLDLTGTRMTAEGQLAIQADNLVSNTNATIECENLSFDLGSSSGDLVFQNMAGASVQGRILGTLKAWSAYWTNAGNIFFENDTLTVSTVTDTNGNTTTTYGITSNQVTGPIRTTYGVLVLDARGLTNSVPVNVYDLKLHSTRITVNDSMNVLQSLLIDGRSLTLNGDITLPGFFPLRDRNPAMAIQTWTSANAPRLLYFTNNGTLSVPNETHFGDDRTTPYFTVVNRGGINAASIQVNSYYFEEDGTLSANAGPLSVVCNSGKFQNGRDNCVGIARFAANSLTFTNYQLSADGELDFTVTNALFDGGPGPGATNQFQTRHGFNLLVKPQTGDLLGTTLQSIAATPTAETVTHLWAGADRGPTPVGYTNNEAVGKLVLSSTNPASVFAFSGTGSHNAIYADLLDLSGLGSNVTSQIQIDPNMVIYYAAAQLSTNFVVPTNSNGIQQEAEEYLNGLLGGRLRWVSSYAGPNSSTTATNGSQTIQVNQALRNSRILDSDGDGTPNASDSTPFAFATVGTRVIGPGTVLNNYDGQSLLVGQTYSMIAQAPDGFVFSGWTGSTSSSSPQLTFVAANGLNFVAHFTFVAPPGSYRGLFFEPEPAGVEFLRSGAITVTTTKSGRYSGALQIGSKRYSLSGQLINGLATNQIPKTPMTLQMQVGNKQVTGTVAAGTDWTADVQADRAVFNARTNKAPFAGKYTLIFPGSGNPTNTAEPLGDGYGTVTVDTSGRVKLAGALADGTRISQSATVSEDGLWPFYLSLYGGQGQILSWLSLAGTPAQGDLGGLFSWIKLANAKARYYREGLDIGTNAIGSKYYGLLTNSLPATVTGFTNASLLLSGGNLAEGIAETVTIGANNKVSVSGDGKPRLTLNASKGSFKGSVRNAASGKTVNFNGVILQRLGFGSGFFLGTNQSGNVLLWPE